jgi:hypothetical protein
MHAGIEIITHIEFLSATIKIPITQFEVPSAAIEIPCAKLELSTAVRRGFPMLKPRFCLQLYTHGLWPESRAQDHGLGVHGSARGGCGVLTSRGAFKVAFVVEAGICWWHLLLASSSVGVDSSRTVQTAGQTRPASELRG